MATTQSAEAPSQNESASHSLLAFLQSQSQNTLTRLYQRPSSCLSIFRSVSYSDPHLRYHTTYCSCRSLLGPLERQVVMNLLWLDSAIAATTLSAWVTREGKKYAATSSSFSGPTA